MKKETICVQVGGIIDPIYKGIVTPVHTSTSFAYLEMDQKRYPRYYNTPNQDAVVKKLCALESAEAGLLLSSGMAAISTVLLSFLKRGDHVIFQKSLYGGTRNFVQSEFVNFGIEFDFVNGNKPHHFTEKIKDNTKVVYVETPSNPLLEIVNLEEVANFAKEKGLISIIDNTFASPINQNPINFGIDLVLHSATKYIGGHSDICAGVVVGRKKLIEMTNLMARNFGGSLNAQTCYLLERSMKTLSLRVNQQNSNAQAIANYLQAHPMIARVNYPGLESHSDHKIAKAQMKGFGGMLSFELMEGIDPIEFQQTLKIVRSSMSLGGVESTICSSTLTSHASLTEEQKISEGISDRLLRLSVGVEDVKDIIEDINSCILLGKK